ncbi:glycogen synthase GlgA [bacterium]|nr:glycogen synthase GlgA [bacterium]MBU0900327.1 glycogen synthase GlgA [bacterium]MBU1152895.1 glycogen synthase GlgA [bacterium]MBU1782492.1 glycogen synthase GlgA [bacterium]MBU2599824.1 glycogen synthase GlgA [bacterium]
MKILLAASEAVPFAKTGGLADVAGTLPQNLKKQDPSLDIRVILPKYKSIQDQDLKLEGSFKVKIGPSTKKVTIKSKVFHGVPFYFVQNDSYFHRDGLYGTCEDAYPDNAARFALFSQAVLKLLKLIDWFPEVIHCNDWQTGLVPVYLKSIYSQEKNYQKIRTLLTIHNIAYQGLFEAPEMLTTNLGWDFFTFDQLEFYGKVNLLKGGIVYADAINTVSKEYAKEIQTPLYGYGLETVLSFHHKTIHGLLNGIDYQEWDPASDSLIYQDYNQLSLEKKKKNKISLLKELNLPYQENIPLVGIVSRLTYQKGFDLLSEAIDKIMKLNLYLIVLGKGEKIYQDLFISMANKYPDKLRVKIDFDDPLGHKIYAASDMFLMPSRYEPCGLGQLISFRYGCVPIVHKIGGLSDTVVEFNFEQENQGNGFTFSKFSPFGLLRTIKKALKTYQDPKIWSRLAKRGMSLDFSWSRSAKKYIKLYEKIYLAKKT